MTRALRFATRPDRVTPLMVVAIALFVISCASPRTNATDAAGADAAADVAPKDLGSPSDAAPPDVAGDKAADSGSGSDGGGADGTDGGADPCQPACLSRLYGGCPIGGTCVYSTGTFCYSNGVILIFSGTGANILERVTKNGTLCATADVLHNFSDPNGAPLGTLSPNGDGSTTITCTGESPVTIPASCPIIACNPGTCPP